MDTVLAPGKSGVHFRIETETRDRCRLFKKVIHVGDERDERSVIVFMKVRMQIQTVFF